MSEIPKAYEPHSVEEKWLRIWHEGGLFTADPKSPKPTYSIVIPPPNVTGALTMGHVLNNTIQDILARKARMEGREVLWLPGTDHAGIATQTVVERALKKSGDIRHRDDLGREKFLERVREWKEKHGGIIVQQLKKLGCSCDWSRERFTMDAAYSQCVQQAFVELYKKGLIYRGKRMVNWCPVSLTALSDEEVVMKEQKGTMFYFKVSVAEQPGVFLTIATTRPETIPGDTAIAVNPADPRHARFIGRHAIRPLPSELAREKKLIPIIGDEHVDFKFGTGVLKVTPAHDKADFEIGRRHALPLIEVIDPAGRMNPAAGADLKGLDRFKARQIAADKLRELGALEKEEPYTNNVGFSERADAPIEPRLSEQWFLKYPGVVKARDSIQHDEVSAPDAASAEKIRFHPQRWARVYDHWMANLEDWCISRQLWWGHRIPVWSPGPDTLSIAGSKGLDLEKFLGGLEERGCVYSRLPARDSGQSEGMAGEIRRFIAIPPGQEEIVQQLERLGFAQDPDVLDTWFSSWLWPFATMGWTGNPDADSGNETLQKFYPTTDLVTGPDIIFFWVARMIMAGYEFMGQLPFHNVYFTGIIRDKQGRKMSKSLGNSPDPLDLIAKYSADALRFGAMRSAPLGQDVLFDEQNVELGRNFCNKVWNACRFRQMQQGEVQGEIEPALLMADDKWVLLKLDRAIREINTAFCEYKFSDVTAT
ncbi:MAG: valine--tRNA ligase, partial [Verrucomicrobia bacterium]|nr:valine--tRNA ligase [Verrucomicrobiota bacterium]